MKTSYCIGCGLRHPNLYENIRRVSEEESLTVWLCGFCTYTLSNSLLWNRIKMLDACLDYLKDSPIVRIK